MFNLVYMLFNWFCSKLTKQIVMVLKLVIDFTAAWCGPCKAMEPKVKEIVSRYPEAVFARVDVDRFMVSSFFLLLLESVK